MISVVEIAKPELREPFPNIPDFWKDPVTGLYVPKYENKNIDYRTSLLANAEKDIILQEDLLAASKSSLKFWVNTFVWTFHQFDVDSGGQRLWSDNAHVPFISWQVQDDLFDELEWCLANGKDILIDKARDMGASWICVCFLHWLWLFKKDIQLLEMSRVENYVDQPGNMKALFQKHDHINQWLPEWMLPPSCLPGKKNRTKLHLFNEDNGSCIDGESTTINAASGDRRAVLLLDEFAKVKDGGSMRSATRDAALVRIINSTPAGPGTEYAKWKKSGQIKVFILPYWDHPQKGNGRYVKEKVNGGWDIRSPWFDIEEKVRDRKHLAQEVLRQDLESGDLFFEPTNIHKHKALFARPPKSRWSVKMNKMVSNDSIASIIRKRDFSKAVVKRSVKGSLRLWVNLIEGRPDQSVDYIFGIDIGKGQSASNSVISIKCKQTGEKVAEWRNAETPPYEMARVAVALALWFGGKAPRRLPFMKWEMNGPGWDFGRMIVKIFGYPYFYRMKTTGGISEKTTDKYGWHSNRSANSNSKELLLREYDRVLAQGGYINHCEFALDEALSYICYPDGSIGPAALVEENASAKKTHGDCVIADALTLDDTEIPKNKASDAFNNIENKNFCFEGRYRAFKKARNAKKKDSYRHTFDFLRS